MIASCNNIGESENVIPIKIIYESYSEAKTSFPGLGCYEDTFALKLLIPNDNFGYKEILFANNLDTFWTSFVQKNLGDNLKLYNDTIIYSGNNREKDTLFQIGHFPPMPLFLDSVSIMPITGFSNKNVTLLYNEKAMFFDKKKSRSLSIHKSQIDSLGIMINRMNPFYVKFYDKYNIVHVIKKNDTVIIRMAYVF